MYKCLLFPLLPSRNTFSPFLAYRKMVSTSVPNGHPRSPLTSTPSKPPDPKQRTFFFDIDNCLYPKSFRIHDHMADLIDAYFQTHLSLTPTDASELHQRYYKDYGLAIEGLVRHHKIDPLEYNAKVDDALPLDEIIKPDPKLRALLEEIRASGTRLWLFTNAYVKHGRRVVGLLGVEDLFEGITFCDYAAERLLCKPAREVFVKAMKEAGVEDKEVCYFVGKLGCVHLRPGA